MTGNNKVWRASLAGLASVAMLATMGVVAGTANAADAAKAPEYTVTLKNADGTNIAPKNPKGTAFAGETIADYFGGYTTGYAPSSAPVPLRSSSAGWMPAARSSISTPPSPVT